MFTTKRKMKSAQIEFFNITNQTRNNILQSVNKQLLDVVFSFHIERLELFEYLKHEISKKFP